MVKIGKLVGCGTAPVQRIKSEIKHDQQQHL